ncbi:WhiB family transcriptional regulator [Kitasatospora sp. NPDC094028]
MSWEALATCWVEKADTELFYPVSYSSPEGAAQVEEARGYCLRCPVAAACLRDALDREGSKDAKSRYGIKGGRTPTQRVTLSRKRRLAAAA